MDRNTNNIVERRLLADQKHIDRAQVEVIVEGKSRKAIVTRMHAGIKLSKQRVSKEIPTRVG